eukprot:CFRG4925T1
MSVKGHDLQKGQVWFVRHAQSQSQYESAMASKYSLPPVVISDPDLSSMGLDQVVQLREHFEKMKSQTGRTIDLVVISPLTRALQTAIHVLPEIQLGTCTVKVCSRIRERSNRACDCGSGPDTLKQRFPCVDFQDLEPNWWQCWHSDNQETVEEVRGRAKSFTQWLKGRKEKTIVVFSHGNFLLHQLGAPRMGNCEVRTWNIPTDTELEGSCRNDEHIQCEIGFQTKIGIGFDTQSS